MTPRVNRHSPPTFHELDEYAFQDLCNEIMGHEDTVSKSNVYGRRGQLQRGIDILSLRKDEGSEIGQCKCEKSFSALKVDKASREFWSHWDYWKDKKIKRFVLFIACEANDYKISDEELKQREDFAKKGILYELWDAATIRNKLRPHRAIARTYIDSEDVIDSICGPLVESTSTMRGLAYMNQSIGFISSELEQLHELELEKMREQSRNGFHRSANQSIGDLKRSHSWATHSPPFQAKVLRFEAAVALNLSRDWRTAERLVAEARVLDPKADYQTIDAYLCYCKKGVDDALLIVEKPLTVEAQNFRWALLLEQENHDQLSAESISPVHDPDAETYKILALQCLALRNISEASTLIDKALTKSPDNLAYQRIRAAISFYLAISQASHGLGRLPWPAPVSWSLIKRDSGAIESLRTAAHTFGMLGDNQEFDEAERRNCRSWQLACLASMEDSQTEAADCASSILAEYPDEYPSVCWALERGYQFDEDRSLSALTTRLESEPENIEVCLAIWTIVFGRNGLQAGEASVDELKPAFEAADCMDLWNYHKAQFLIARNDNEAAIERIAAIQDPFLATQANLNIERKKASDSKIDHLSGFASSLEDSYESSADPQTLFECCELKLRLGNPAYPAANARKLIETVGTAPAVRLGLQATFENGDYQICLDLLNEFASLFRESTLSPDVRRLRSECLYNLGIWNESIEESQRIYSDYPTFQNWQHLFSLYHRSGNLTRCSLLAQDLFKLDRVRKETLLDAASIVRFHDQSLAISLWEAARKKKFNKSSIMTKAMDLAYSLGLSKEAGELLDTLVNSARTGKGPLQMKTLEETKELMREQQKLHSEVIDNYMNGNVPIHFVAEILHHPLAFYFRRLLEDNRANSNLLRASPIFARAGNRPVSNRSIKHIIADITSLLLINDLGLIAEFEESFSHIYISPKVTASLLDQLGKVTPVQADRSEARKTFLSLIEKKSAEAISPLTSSAFIPHELRQHIEDELLPLLHTAVEQGGSIVTSGSIFKIGSPCSESELSPGIRSHLVDLRDFKKLLDGSSGSVAIADGSSILIPESLIAGITSLQFKAAVLRFKVRATPEAISTIQSEVASELKNNELKSWLHTLLERIQRGIAIGKYRILPTAPKMDGDREIGPEAGSLTDILSYKAPEGTVVWCDDRFLNRHSYANSSPIVGVTEILNILRKKIGDTSYFAALSHLRRSNIRYIPLTSEEIQHHLAKATQADGSVVESPNLETIRRYLNATILDNKWLQSTPSSPEQGDFRSYNYPLSLFKSVDGALFDIWKNGQELKSIEAQADWILDNISLHIVGVRQCLIDNCTAEEVRSSSALMISSLFAKGVGLPSKTENPAYSPRKNYFDWLCRRIVDPITPANPTILDLIRADIAETISNQLHSKTKSRKGDLAPIVRRMLADLIIDLPPVIGHHLNFDDESLNLLGLTANQSAQVNGLHYPSSEFWSSMAGAVSGRRSALVDREGKNQIELSNSASDNKSISIVATDSKGAVVARLSEPAYEILHEDESIRREFLRRNKSLFNIGGTTADSQIDRIVAIDSPMLRMEALTEQRSKSVDGFYTSLRSKLRGPKGQLGLIDLINPNWEGTLEFLRLSEPEPERDVVAAFVASAESLVTEQGFFEGLHRHMSFPRLLPENLEYRWKELSDEEAQNHLVQLQALPKSLINEVHLIRLALLRTTTDSATIARETLESLLDETTAMDDFHDFKELLEFSEEDFSKWDGGIPLPEWKKLSCIWLHASRLHAILKGIQLEKVKLHTWIRSNRTFWNNNILRRPPGADLEIAEPSNFGFGWLVLHGLAACIGDLEDIRSKIEIDHLAAPFLAEGTLTRLGLLRRADYFVNSLGSFIGSASDQQLECLYGPDQLEAGFGMLGEDTLMGLLQELKTSDHDPHLWAWLEAVIGRGKVSEQVFAAIIDLSESYDYLAFSSSSPMQANLALAFTARQIARTSDSEKIDRFANVIFECASQSPPSGDSANPSDDGWAHLSLALWSLSRDEPGEAIIARKYFNYMKRLMEIRPDIARRFPDAWLLGLPMEQQTNMWPCVFTARALK